MTIKDIARIANVSTATVSRVINNKHKGNVSTATYNRIIQLLEETNFIPDAIASGLRTGLTKAVGIVFPDNVNPYYAELGNAIENACFEAGYTALLCNTKQDIDREKKYVRLLSNQRVAGIILCSTGLSCKEIKENNVSESTKVILVDEAVEGFEGPVVIGDDVQGGYIGMNYLLTTGHTNILVVTGPMSLSSASNRLQGLMQCASEHGFTMPENNIIKADYSISSAYSNICRILEKKINKFTAIFAFNDLMALGALKALDEHHIKVPGEVSVLGYDGIFIDTLTKPTLTTVATPIREMGIESFKKIIEGEPLHEYQKSIILQPKIVIRESCRNLR